MVEKVPDAGWIENATGKVLRHHVNGLGVLDPAFGFGSFLYHTARTILGHPSIAGLTPVVLVDVVAQLNRRHGHPSRRRRSSRVNVQRALPAKPSGGAPAFRVPWRGAQKSTGLWRIQRALEGLDTALGLQAGGIQAQHLDIASFFVLRTRALYAAGPEIPGFVVGKRSAIRYGKWVSFRHKHSVLDQSVDLEDLSSFQGGDATRCCLLLEHRQIPGSTGRKLLARQCWRWCKKEGCYAG